MSDNCFSRVEKADAFTSVEGRTNKKRFTCYSSKNVQELDA